MNPVSTSHPGGPNVIERAPPPALHLKPAAGAPPHKSALQHSLIAARYEPVPPDGTYMGRNSLFGHRGKAADYIATALSCARLNRPPP
eukprot:5696462-Prymnesium_polylepis.1